MQEYPCQHTMLINMAVTSQNSTQCTSMSSISVIESPYDMNGGTKTFLNHSEDRKEVSIRFRRPLLRLLRCAVVDVPLALLFALFMCVYAIRSIHDNYYVPLMDRAERTNDDLELEYTYYKRECTEYDLSTYDIQDLFVNATAPLSISVAQMMTHGALVIPQILQQSTTRKLRAWVVQRNAAVAEAETYPVSQGFNRLSYGIDPTEHPHVAEAVAEVANHKLLRPILQTILGDEDPASAEITVITSYAGSPDQAWHSDTKSDGNALKFARTYSHSYSLFIPLQDTTAAMGTTDVCPGTHYCANALHAMCEQTKMGLNEATPEQVFREGDGALFNQHVWHRGSAHTDYDAQERVVFILSFLARPKSSDAVINDVRQLSRGTYFHQKWNIWGHTLRDLMDPMHYMKKPFSVLRCLSLWKPLHANWGYDLVTSGFMRFSNRQLQGDLEYRFLPRLNQLGYPIWLQGSIPEDTKDEKVQWQMFISDSIQRLFTFVKKINLIVHGIYIFSLLFVAIAFYDVQSRSICGSLSMLRRTMRRIIFTHVFAYVSIMYLLYKVRSSSWGQNILTGKTLMRPFPYNTVTRNDVNQMIVKGPTTLPTRNDVLIGTRYDAPFLGSYDRWLDYHPGNVLFQKLIVECIPMFAWHLLNVDMALARHCIQYVQNTIFEANGRFLQQDYRTGDWRVMDHLKDDKGKDDGEIFETIVMQIAVSSSPVLRVLQQQLDWFIADCRFGHIRDTSLARHGQLRSWHLKKRLFNSWLPKRTLATTKSLTIALQPLGSLSLDDYNFPFWSQLQQHMVTPFYSLSFEEKQSKRPAHAKGFSKREQSEIREGSPVWVFYPVDSLWYPATITAVHFETSSCAVSYNEGSVAHDINLQLVQLRIPVVEGDNVEACYAPGLNDCYPGEIIHVMPSGNVAVKFDDGDVAWHVPPWDFYTPPLMHAAVNEN